LDKGGWNNGIMDGWMDSKVSLNVFPTIKITVLITNR
jgi:hypothetical protein